jgi:ceramide glucosyltransferase
MILIEWLLVAVVAGTLVFGALVVVAALRAPVRPGVPGSIEPVSVLKPLAGSEDGLEDNLRSFFTQDYPKFEILFAVRHADDPAVPVVVRLQREYRSVPSRLLITGEPPYSNAKVWSLAHLTDAAQNDLLVMSDSDIRAGRDFLQTVAAEFSCPATGLATCPYRALAGASFWSRLEATMMNSEFLSGILVARMIEGMKFAVGPTIVARKRVIASIGGWNRVKDYLAEDFMLGHFAAESGCGVGLSSYVVEHHIGSQDFSANVQHRLRWCRSTRRSRPAGYAGQLFTLSLPWALLLLATVPAWWPLAAATVTMRLIGAWLTSAVILKDRLAWWMLPLSDLASFGFWLAGFFGNTIVWRGRSYHLHGDGRFERIA